MKLTLSDMELSLVSEKIESLTGLCFQPAKWSMLERNLLAASGEFEFTDLHDFVKWICSSYLSVNQVEVLSSYLIISESYFWREHKTFDALLDYVLPELVRSRSKTEKFIRIWSAACSTGEEPYSIAIALKRAIPDIESWKVRIIASDINQKALKKAREGIFTQWSFRNSPCWLKPGYFTSIGNNKYEIAPEIRKMVTFSTFNLNSNNYLSTICRNKRMDIIYCCNVLMYFSDAAAARASSNLYNALSDSGWLIVSSCELSVNLFPQFNNVNFQNAILYRKKRRKKQHEPDILLHSGPDSIPDIYDAHSFRSEDSDRNNSDLVFKDRYIEDSVKMPENPSISAEFIHSTIPESQEQAVRSLADQGYLAEALLACDDAITEMKFDPGLYFLKASILQEMNKSEEAIKSLRQSVYVDPDYLIGHFTLGSLLTAQGKLSKAKRSFENALDLLSRFGDSDIIDGSGGLSARHLRDLIQSNLTI